MKKMVVKTDFLEKLKISSGQKKYIYTLLALAMIGIVSIILGSRLSTGEPPPAGNAKTVQTATDQGEPVRDELTQHEAQLAGEVADILGKVQGVGTVAVKVTLASTTETAYAIDRQSNQTKTNEVLQNGGTRTTDETRADEKLVMRNQAQGETVPIILKENRPQVVGVMVVADGATDLVIKEQVTRAVQVLLDIPSHKITVLPKERGAA